MPTTVAQTAQGIYVKQVTIAASASASEAIETCGAIPVAVFCPTTTDVTTTHFKIQACLTSSGTFVDALNSSGAEIEAAMTASAYARFNAAVYAPYIKLVAITTGDAADAQDAARTISLVLSDKFE